MFSKFQLKLDFDGRLYYDGINSINTVLFMGEKLNLLGKEVAKARFGRTFLNFI